MLEADGDCGAGLMDTLPAKITYGDKYGRAMTITSQAEADAYFERCVAHQLSFGKSSREEAESIERSNLGYWAGYYDDETRRRVERLFRCAHPVFGAIEKVRPPTAVEAYEMGLARGAAARE